MSKNVECLDLEGALGNRHSHIAFCSSLWWFRSLSPESELPNLGINKTIISLVFGAPPYVNNGSKVDLVVMPCEVAL